MHMCDLPLQEAARLGGSRGFPPVSVTQVCAIFIVSYLKSKHERAKCVFSADGLNRLLVNLSKVMRFYNIDLILPLKPITSTSELTF